MDFDSTAVVRSVMAIFQANNRINSKHQSQSDTNTIPNIIHRLMLERMLTRSNEQTNWKICMDRVLVSIKNLLIRYFLNCSYYNFVGWAYFFFCPTHTYLCIDSWHSDNIIVLYLNTDYSTNRFIHSPHKRSPSEINIYRMSGKQRFRRSWWQENNLVIIRMPVRRLFLWTCVYLYEYVQF